MSAEAVLHYEAVDGTWFHNPGETCAMQAAIVPMPAGAEPQPVRVG